MRLIFVGRHGGALDWLTQKMGQPDLLVPHMGDQEVASLQAGDRVVGVLPPLLIEKVMQAGAEVLLLVLPNLPPEKRGQELSASEMEALGARLLRVRSLVLEEVD